MKKLFSIIALLSLVGTSLLWTHSAQAVSMREVIAANELAMDGIIKHQKYNQDIVIQFQDRIKDFLEAEKHYGIIGLTELQIEKFVEGYNLESNITRQEIMKIIAKISGETIPESCDGKFNDVAQSGWGCKYIEWALRKGYIARNATFRPEDNITKTEAIKLIMKVKGLDKTQITSNWQSDYAESALQYGLVENAYTDYDASALRGWVFAAALAAIIKKEEILEEEGEEIKEILISDEAL